MKKIITNLFQQKKGNKLYSILVTDEMLNSLKDNMPSGGWYKDFCMNSELFQNRVCKQDKRKYKKGYRCPCFI